MTQQFPYDITKCLYTSLQGVFFSKTFPVEAISLHKTGSIVIGEGTKDLNFDVLIGIKCLNHQTTAIPLLLLLLCPSKYGITHTIWNNFSWELYQDYTVVR